MNFKDYYGRILYFIYIPLTNSNSLDVAGGVDITIKNVYTPYS